MWQTSRSVGAVLTATAWVLVVMGSGGVLAQTVDRPPVAKLDYVLLDATTGAFLRRGAMRYSRRSYGATLQLPRGSYEVRAISSQGGGVVETFSIP